jgi:hypothetical protein
MSVQGQTQSFSSIAANDRFGVCNPDIRPDRREGLILTAGSTGQCNTARSLSAGVSKPKVFRGR